MAAQQTVAIIGGGLVGAISACFFAKRGFVVDLYEYREDIRLTKHVRGRTINLTLAARGQMALRQLGLEEAVVRRHGVALRGRMVHANGTRRAILYDPVSQQCTYSVSRRFLNELLLTATEKYSNVRLHFKHKLVGVNFDENKMTFLVEGGFVERTASLVVGADGAFSAVRRHMLKQPLFDFSQKYIEHGYLELCIPPTPEGQFAMEPDYLHLWPRGTFMMIALPNQDCSWTVTLFMPLTQFATLSSPEVVIPFFEENFPDAVQLIGRERLVRDFLSAQPSTLITIKCNPYNVGNSAVIIGDAAHAMVPFYGQGMNAGFEDCLLLNDLLDQYNNDLSKVLPLFSKIRNKDAEAICDLAMYNYFEMRDLVNRRWFLLRKKLDYILYCLMPNLWIPLYHSVTFTSKGYRWCYDNKIWQDKVLKFLLHLCVLLITIGVVLIAWFILPAIRMSNCISASGFDL